MFVTTSTHRFWWPVVLRRPSLERPGDYEDERCEMLFEALEPDAADAFVARAAAATKAAEVRAVEIDQLAAIVRNWRDVVDDDRQPVTWSEEAFRAACRWPWVRMAVGQAYAEAIGGGARLGN